MIQEWSLEAFKCVAQRQQLEFRPLTVFAGANSSGKSTVLQSILLICQTLASKVERRQLLLNGDLVRLGTLDDILSHAEQNAPTEIVVAFKLRPSPRLIESARAVQLGSYFWAPWFHPYHRTAATVEAELHFRKVIETGSKAQHAELVVGAFAATPIEQVDQPGSDDQAKAPAGNFTIKRRTDEAAEQMLFSGSVERMVKENLEAGLKYSVDVGGTISPESFPYISQQLRGQDSLELVGSTLGHFLPQALIVRYSVLMERIVALLERWETTEREKTNSTWPASDDEVQRAIAAVLRDFEHSDEPRQAGDRLRRRMRSDKSMRAIVEQVKLKLKDSEAAKKTAFALVPGTELTGFITSSIVTEFAFLRYLGPLRDEPRALHDIGSGADPKDVGTKGEFTAAVLDLFGSTKVDFIPPNDLSSSIQQCTLSTAVHTWLRHFDIAQRIETMEEGKLGHRLYVVPEGMERRLDLTNVGVGVSQVLPILVMALISEPGSVLLFEQPELHLHPRVQSQLADFFLSVMKTGRQCILETHSEYLVNRLRRRVAETAWGSDLSSNILLYFVERRASQSTFEPVEINAYGAIPEWPSGFFDQAPAESESILAAADRKRAAKPKR